VTTAVYNQTGEARIPAYVWTAGLGLSVGAHLAVIIYGLPYLSWDTEQLPEPAATEITIESNDLNFETAAVVESVAAETATPDAVAVPPTEAVPVPVEPLPSVETVPDSSDVLTPAETVAANPETVLADQVETSQVEPGAAVLPERIETSAAQAVPQSTAEPLTSAAAEPVVATAPEIAAVAPSQSVAVSVAPPVSTVVVGKEIEPAAVQQVPETPTVVTVQPSTAIVLPSTVPTDDEGIVVVTAPATTAQPTNTTQTQAEAANVSSVTPVQSVEQASNPVAVAPGSVVAPVTAAPATAPSVAVSSSSQVSTVTSVTAPVVTSNTLQVEAGSVQAVDPVEEQIAAIRPSEIGLPSIEPSDPDPSNVPAAPVTTDPAPNVSPTEIATIDPLADVTAYVSSYNVGECAHLTVMSAGTDTAQVTAFGATIAPFVQFDQKFKADQGYEANIEVRLVTGRQCALLNALGPENGVEAAGLVELDNTVVKSGTRVSGVIQRDLPIGRIAQAEAAGLELNGKGPPELYLIDDAGQIHDGRSFVRHETSTVRVGGWRFAVPVTLISGSPSETALILTVWNRPKGNQPPEFRSLPADRIASVLAEPGVYSLSAFKVSR